ncbi:helix-turn-helix transcriptional regulator [Myroides marinus]|uniref:helix-turn-helix domain-containing protein n=2 Tax=Myroides marinus TaxID=703342 RepID=UPI0025786648|nr:AraC family transcriptional regulator [Myroides marinus]MDM1352133.1 helix-turn-helix transcriptional regulator [Myroides marinus]MDM1359326.1 helix-turn-helix transcriptional regulator [Myroides marinus]MDM1362426.1 helix-turn-helix transcriptional regulator [Myroides marinus]MDM1370111.1 helix-turn-helix transcriptional regulator [Myroides marinus]MDM1373705.1 helix-turn-helix transcriptional regulator [Myroides marinus]
MRLDLVHDFKIVLTRFLSHFIHKLNGSSNKVLEQSITTNVTVMLDKIFYFCCKKKYFGLSENICSNNSFSYFLHINRTSNQWVVNQCDSFRVVGSIDISKIINALENNFNPSKKYIKQVVSFIINQDKKNVLVLGIAINKNKQHQVFYLWFCKLNKSKNEPQNILVHKEQKLLFKNFYLDYLEQLHHSPSPILINKYISSLNYQPKAFQTNFKKYVGTTFYDYHIQNRLLKALELLMFSNLSVTEIVYECGYDSYRTFIKAFSKDQDNLPLYYRILKA